MDKAIEIIGRQIAALAEVQDTMIAENFGSPATRERYAGQIQSLCYVRALLMAEKSA